MDSGILRGTETVQVEEKADRHKLSEWSEEILQMKGEQNIFLLWISMETFL